MRRGALEAHEVHERADRHGLFDERRVELRRRDRDVDPPALGEEPLVAGVVHPGDHARDSELLLRQQRDDKVVLIVPGRGDHHVDLGDAGGLERRHLAGVRHDPAHVDVGLKSSDLLGIDLENLHVVAVDLEVGGDRHADAAAARDRDLHACTFAATRHRVPRSSSSAWSSFLSTATWSTSPSWPDERRRIEAGRACARHGDEPDLPADLECGELLTGETLGQDTLDEQERPRAVVPLRRELIGEQPAPDLVDGPGDGRHRGDAEALIHQCALRVVDARDHALHPERLAGDARREDVGVVAGRDRSEGVRVLDASLGRAPRGRIRTPRPRCP